MVVPIPESVGGVMTLLVQGRKYFPKLSSYWIHPSRGHEDGRHRLPQ